MNSGGLRGWSLLTKTNAGVEYKFSIKCFTRHY